MIIKVGKDEIILMEKKDNGKYSIATNCSTLVQLINKPGKVIILKDKKKYGELTGTKLKSYTMKQKEWLNIVKAFDKRPL